ncbi:MAG TPA: Uma2 family endonuclease [Polyangiaceae bacterium]|nr:Uma2 family endonuclease [Polyangiaceae bacterium]
MNFSCEDPDDPIDYPVEEKVGEGLLQTWLVESLRPLVERWLAERGEVALVGADQFIYFEKGQPGVRVSPDVYVLPGVPPDTCIDCWKTWLTGVVPSFALEVVSKKARKDYVLTPQAHQQLGTAELVIFDPKPHLRRTGVRFQRFERTGGRLQLCERTDADRVYSSVLECYLKMVPWRGVPQVRLALPPDGTALYPTALEAERAARMRAEAERGATQARIAELEAALARARGDEPTRTDSRPSESDQK